MTHSGGIAFNAADTFILGGNLILIVTLCSLVLKNREHLRSPRAALRLVRDRRAADRL